MGLGKILASTMLYAAVAFSAAAPTYAASPKKTTHFIVKRNGGVGKTLGAIYEDRNGNGIINKEDREICKSLELPDRGNKQNVSCIPNGIYDVFTTPWTVSFEYPHLGVLRVPGRGDVAFHRGNKLKDTEGCILPGSYFGPGPNYVLASGPALERLMEYLPTAPDKKNPRIKMHVIGKPGEYVPRAGARFRQSLPTISDVQRQLNDVYGSRLDVDGKLGSKTAGAIRKFQSDNGLKVDGIFGPRTKAMLEHLGKAKKKGKR